MGIIGAQFRRVDVDRLPITIEKDGVRVWRPSLRGALGTGLPIQDREMDLTLRSMPLTGEKDDYRRRTQANFQAVFQSSQRVQTLRKSAWHCNSHRRFKSARKRRRCLP